MLHARKTFTVKLTNTSAIGVNNNGDNSNVDAANAEGEREKRINMKCSELQRMLRSQG